MHRGRGVKEISLAVRLPSALVLGESHLRVDVPRLHANAIVSRFAQRLRTRSSRKGILSSGEFLPGNSVFGRIPSSSAVGLVGLACNKNGRHSL